MPLENFLLISKISFKEDTPPDAITGVLMDLAKVKVCSKLTPCKLPSREISV